MLHNEKIYQSILIHLGNIPVDSLQQVDNYLKILTQKRRSNQKDIKDILGFAGSWNDMNENDFQDFLVETKNQGVQLFNKEVEL